MRATSDSYCDADWRRSIGMNGRLAREYRTSHTSQWCCDEGGSRGYKVGLATGAEEVGEERAALRGEEAGGDFDFVIELGVVHDGENGAACAGLGVGRGVDEAGDARVE